jgi:hypothetical protein
VRVRLRAANVNIFADRDEGARCRGRNVAAARSRFIAIHIGAGPVALRELQPFVDPLFHRVEARKGTQVFKRKVLGCKLHVGGER